MVRVNFLSYTLVRQKTTAKYTIRFELLRLSGIGYYILEYYIKRLYLDVCPFKTRKTGIHDGHARDHVKQRSAPCSYKTEPQYMNSKQRGQGAYNRYTDKHYNRDELGISAAAQAAGNHNRCGLEGLKDGYDYHHL